jgi:aspartyl-tRNA(Asn)/glutamyl-tRNA(Gln) amidotransferase subunit A
MNVSQIPTSLIGLSISQAARLIAAREISPLELAEALLSRIAETQPSLNAYITVLGDKALDAARLAEKEIMSGKQRSALHGIPFAVKDNYHVAGIPTTGGSRLMEGYIADHTATPVARLQDAGAILLGKLNTWEYGTGNGEVHDDLPYPLARNPYDVTRFSGGSSTGAGVAVAAGAAVFALGSDTGGSVRLPAAATGVQGMKATFGRVSRAGILPNCWTCDIAGPLTWTVKDNALVLGTIAGFDPSDPQSANRPMPDMLGPLNMGVAGMRIGVIRDFGPDAPSPQPEVAARFEAALDSLRAQGAVLLEAALPEPVSAYRSALSVINWSESYSIHEKDFLERHHLMGRSLRGKMLAGFMVRAADYLAAQRARRALACATDAVITKFDAVITLTTLSTAPPFGDQALLSGFTGGSVCSPFSISGHPAMAVATGFDDSGLPTSLQIIGKYFDEATIYRVAQAVEQGLPERQRPVL